MPRNATSCSESAGCASAGLPLRRGRLLRRLRPAVEAPLSVVAGPAGAGKSVLVRQWVAERQHVPTSWVQLRRESDAPRVAAGLLTGVSRLGADIGDAVRDWVPQDDGVLGRRWVGTLVSSLASAGEVVLVLDALDAPHDPVLVRELERIVDDLPPNVHAVVTRRRRWTGPSGRPRRRPAVVLDGPELAFTRGESRLLVRQETGRDLSAAQLDALMQRTQGWAIGLRLAVALLRGTDDPDEAIAALRGDERRIAQFLRDEVLDPLPPRLRRFLLRASVLDGLSAAECRAVTDDPASGVVLRRLEHDNVVIGQPPAGDAPYRIHGLFRDLLRSELRRNDPGAEVDLLERAAAWHLGRGEPEQAAAYLVTGERWDRLVDLLDRHGRYLFERGRVPEMLRWIEAVPLGGSRRSHVVLQRAYVLTMAGRARQAEELLRTLDAGQRAPGEQVVIDTLRATWAFFDASPGPAMAAADSALAALGGDEPCDERVEVPDVLGLTSRADLAFIARGSRARALWCAGDVGAARRAFTALAADRDAYVPWRVHVLGSLALLEAWAGRLHLGDRYARFAIAVAAGARLLDHPAAHDAYLAVAHVRGERLQLAAAEEALKLAQVTTERKRRPVAIAIQAVERATLRQTAGEPQRGLAELRAYRSTSEALPPPIVEDRLRAAEARLLLATGSARQAALLVEAAPGPRSPEMTAISVQAAVTGGDRAAARGHLERWPTGKDGPRSRLERELWTAILEFEEGERRSALRRAARVVADAGADGHRRLFVDAGPSAEHLRRALLARAADPAVEALLGAADAGAVPAARAPVHALSRREQEIVRYLPTPLSAAQIAGRLYISVNTLKTHLRTIYRKFGVSDRRGAIQRAQELGIA